MEFGASRREDRKIPAHAGVALHRLIISFNAVAGDFLRAGFDKGGFFEGAANLRAPGVITPC
jgi:hypothetical protein